MGWWARWLSGPVRRAVTPTVPGSVTRSGLRLLSGARAATVGRGLLWAGAALAAGLAAYLWVRFGDLNLYRVEANTMAMHVDFDTFHSSAVALLHGRNLYNTGAAVPNLDPPLWTVLMAPFGLIPALPAYRLFALLTLVLMLGCYALVARELRLPVAPAGLALCAMFASSPLLSTIALGQVYGLLLTGLVGVWFADRRGRPVLAGVLLGLVVALKPTIAPLLILPVLHRDRPMIIAAFGAAAGGTLVGLLVPGPSQTWSWLRLLAHTSISTMGDNASLPSFVMRLGGPTWLGLCLGAAAIAITAWRIWRGGSSALALWALTAACLLMSPVAWHNYLVMVFPGTLVILGQRRHALAALLLTAPVIGIEWAALWSGDGLTARLGHSLYCGILLTFWVSLTACLPRCRPATDRGDTVLIPAPPALADAHQ